MWLKSTHTIGSKQTQMRKRLGFFNNTPSIVHAVHYNPAQRLEMQHRVMPLQFHPPACFGTYGRIL